jgi:hypothetical protein
MTIFFRDVFITNGKPKPNGTKSSTLRKEVFIPSPVRVMIGIRLILSPVATPCSMRFGIKYFRIRRIWNWKSVWSSTFTIYMKKIVKKRRYIRSFLFLKRRNPTAHNHTKLERSMKPKYMKEVIVLL